MKKTITLLSIITLSAMLFTGCHDAIFATIEKDVPPETATVSGIINSITRYSVGTEELLFVAANGGLRYKLATTGNERKEKYKVVGKLFSSGPSFKTGSSWKTLDEKSLPADLKSYDYDQEKGVFEGETILKTAADENNFYILSCVFKGDNDSGVAHPDTYKIYANSNFALEDNDLKTTRESWVNITEDNEDIFVTLYDESNKYYYTDFNMFSTNAIQPSHRAVFFRKGFGYEETPSATYYKLSGTGIEEITVEKPEELEPAEDSEKTKSVYKEAAGNYVHATTMTLNNDSVAYLNGKYYFFDSIAAATNETKTKEATYIYSGSTSKAKTETIKEDEYAKSKYYHSHNESSTLCYFWKNAEGNNEFVSNTNVEHSISCITVNQDSLLIGCASYSLDGSTFGGVRRVLLTDGKPETETTGFINNMPVQFNSYFLFALLSVDPDTIEEENISYCSVGFKTSGASTSVSYKNVGLWAYYPDRENWNRE